ncbi:MAG: glycosyltransferase family 4 protein [Gammaproteobacteria bacterium]|nr:glycosyltransferase family 4 protein [Gammaproteobacteria bacterium]
MANSGWSWHLFTAPAIWISWWLNVPVVINYRGGEAEAFFQNSIRWINPSLAKVDCIAVPSSFLQAVFQKFGLETVIVPNIIDLERFGRTKPKKLNTERPHIIVCRNLEAIYDVATAVRAFSLIAPEIPGATLSVAGEGPEGEALRALVADLGIVSQVTFTGRLDVEAMMRLYHSADLMLNASRVDNMPNALLESMAAGVPIVTTDAGGIPHMVEQGVTAELVAIGDWKMMAEKSLAILNDQQQHANLAEACEAAVDVYQWNSVKPLWLQIYGRIAKPSVEKAAN